MILNAHRARWPEAETLSREAVRLTAEKNPRFLRTFAQALRLTGRFDEARGNLDKATVLLEAQPEKTQALEEIAKEVATEFRALEKDQPKRVRTRRR
jgi:Flp pilus assembly protein TadD